MVGMALGLVNWTLSFSAMTLLVELSMVGMALGLVNWTLSFSAMTLLVGSSDL